MFRTSAAQVVRASCRQQTFNSSAAARRFASTETKTAADKAKQSASSAFASAQKTMGSLGESGSKVLKGVQTRAEGALGEYKEPIFGNLAVAREVLKQVYVAEKLSPPSMAQVSQTYSGFFRQAGDMAFWRNMLQSGEWKRWGIYALEAYGIFCIGEMIGRRHIVGYKLNESKLAHTV